MAFLRDIEGDYYYFDEVRYEVVGRNTGRRLTLGDEVWIRVKGADLRRRTLDFELVMPDASSKAAPGRPSPSDQHQAPATHGRLPRRRHSANTLSTAIHHL